jgi:acetoin utilization deacetylase AcuC-like enzyme
LVHSYNNRALSLRYCDHYHFPLPDGHKFPVTKYRLLREALEQEGRFLFEPAEPVRREALLRVHGQDYVDGFLKGTLDRQAMRRIGFPWSAELVTRTLASAGGTLAATRTALKTGFGGTLAGGTHHAYRDEGSGFCVFNDLAIAIASANGEGAVKRAAVIDLDVHQGDGTASIFDGDPCVFTLSLHGARNFPFRKQKSSLDIELPDGTSDAEYLTVLAPALEHVWRFGPQLILFQAGVDGLASDRLGRLSLTLEGLRHRDLLVIGETHCRGIPLVITIGGGYSEPIEKTVEANAQTFLIAADIYCEADLTPDSPSHPNSMPELYVKRFSTI